MGSPRAGCQLIQFLVRAPFLACGQPPPGWVLTRPFLGACVQVKGQQGLSSSSKATNTIMRDPPSWPHLTLITPQRPHLLIPSQWGLGLQHTDLVEDKALSPLKREASSKGREAGNHGLFQNMLEQRLGGQGQSRVRRQLSPRFSGPGTLS